MTKRYPIVIQTRNEELKLQVTKLFLQIKADTTLTNDKILLNALQVFQKSLKKGK